MDQTVLAMFPTVDEYRGWRIERRPPGFEFTPGLLGKITSYVAVAPGGDLAIFAFMYSFLVTSGPAGNEDELAEAAVGVIHNAIDSDAAIAGSERTYELIESAWGEVRRRPSWWISVIA